MKNSICAENLRYLCATKSSISQVCRETGINRQQFNKYLAGKFAPSRVNLQRLAHYFYIDSQWLFLPHSEFMDALHNPASLGKGFENKKVDQLGQLLFQKAPQDVRRYCGFYHGYYYSMSYPGYITKSLCHFYLEDGWLLSKTLEKIRKKDDLDHRGSEFKYSGLVSLIADRLHLVERETLLNKNVFFTILYPSYKSTVEYLYGVSEGVSASGAKFPACRNIIYEFLGTEIDKRAAIAQCGVYPEESECVSAQIKAVLNKQVSPNPHLFTNTELDF